MHSIGEVKSEMVFTPYGLAQYRLRFDYQINTDKNENKTSIGNYSNRIGYKVGLKVTVNPQVLAQFEIGNDWSSTEGVSDITGNYAGRRNATIYPWFSLAFMQWDPGYMHISAGIVPVKGTALMDLYGVSITNNKKYKAAAHTSWLTNTNGGITALKTGAPLVKGDFKLGIDLLTTVLEQRNVTALKDITINNPAVTVLLDISMSYQDLTVLPQFILVGNRNFRDDASIQSGSDHELGTGIDLGYKLNKEISFRAGFGISSISNENTRTAADTAYDQLGTNTTFGTTIKAGPGKIDFDFNISTDENREKANSAIYYPFIDLRYAIALNKNFSITPRGRMFFTNNSDNSGILLIRPELIISGSF